MANFSVTAGDQAILAVGGLFVGEKYNVLRLACTSCEEEIWAPYSPYGQPITLSQDTNPVVITLSGRYKVQADGILNCNAVVCCDIEKKCCGS